MDGMSQRTSPGTLPLSRCKLSFWVHVTHMVKNGGHGGGEDASHTTEHVTGQDSGGPRGPLWKACSRKRVPEGFLILLHRTCWVFLKVIEKTVQNALRGTRDALGDMWKAMTLRREARRGAGRCPRRVRRVAAQLSQLVRGPRAEGALKAQQGLDAV